MEEYIICNGIVYPCCIRKDISIPPRETISFYIEGSYESIKDIFHDNELETAHYANGVEENISDYCLLTRIDDLLDGSFRVIYSKMTDLEKMVNLHYGGVN